MELHDWSVFTGDIKQSLSGDEYLAKIAEIRRDFVEPEEPSECDQREVNEKFLSRYIVPNYFLPEQLGVKPNEVEGFKKYVQGWACSGAVNEIMEEVLANFRSENDESENDEPPAEPAAAEPAAEPQEPAADGQQPPPPSLKDGKK
eukprot:SAG22_NODE_827_length_6957_cov_4.434821_4_plen_146_part_00